MKNRLQHIALIFYLCAYIYTPPVFGISMRHIAGGIAWIYILKEFPRLRKRILNTKKTLLTLAGMFFFFILVGIISLLNENSIKVVSFYLYWLIDVLPGAIFVADFAVRMKYHLFDLFCGAALIQAILAILAFLSNGFHQILLNIMSNSGFYTEEFLNMVKGWRAYGLSSALFFDMPILQAFLSIIALYLGITRKKIYLILSFIFILSAIVNNRTSALVFILGLPILLFMLIVSLQKKKEYMKIVFLCITSVSILCVFVFSPLKDLPTFDWLISGILEFNPFSKKRHTIDILMDMIILPEDINLIFGHGLRIMGGSEKYMVASDVGYVNDIWTGGIFYAVLKYTFFVIVLNYIRKNMKNKVEGLCYFLYSIVILFVCNTKGQIFSPNCFTIQLFVVFFYTIYFRRLSDDPK